MNAYELGYRRGLGLEKTAYDKEDLLRHFMGSVAAPGAVGAGGGLASKYIKNLVTGESGGYLPWALGGAGLGVAGNATLDAAESEDIQGRLSRHIDRLDQELYEIRYGKR